MAIDAKTVAAEFLYSVKEFADGTPWIYFDSRRGVPPEIDNLMFGFELPSGTTIQMAQEVADYMNDHVTVFSVTFFNKSN